MLPNMNIPFLLLLLLPITSITAFVPPTTLAFAHSPTTTTTIIPSSSSLHLTPPSSLDIPLLPPSYSSSPLLLSAEPIDPAAAFGQALGTIVNSPAILAVPILAAVGVASLIAFLIVAYANPADPDEE